MSGIVNEVFTWPWLTALSQREGRAVTLGDVPADAWDALALPGVDTVWLMGVWRRSAAGRAVALSNVSFRAATENALPDATAEDVVGSPYCIRGYEVDEHLGGEAGLARARAALAERGLRLLLDWVPNHVAPDHPWVTTHPEFFVHGSEEEHEQHPGDWLGTPSGPIAYGRDPYFPPWPDVVQLNPWSRDLRDEVVATLTRIAERCDGVRCDMAMLFLDDVAARTWGDQLGKPLPEPYWREVVRRVKAIHPEFLFVAEAYWDLESRLFDEGIDRCYDKRLLDRLVGGDAGAVRSHLGADPAWQARLVRFLENHDEPRSAAAFPRERLRPAALALLTLPGTVLLYDGQTRGARVRLPVHLGRAPEEPVDAEPAAMWDELLALADRQRIRSGAWELLAVDGWDDNRTCENLLAWRWAQHVVVVNYSGVPSAGRVRLGRLDERPVLVDLLDGARYERDAGEIEADGLFVSLPPWGAHLFALGTHAPLEAASAAAAPPSLAGA